MLKSLLSSHKKRLDRVYECKECGYFYRLNQIDYSKVTKEIINKNLLGNQFYYEKHDAERVFGNKSFDEENANYVMCPNCNCFSKRNKHHSDLDDQEVKYTQKTNYSMYYKIYKSKKDACNYLYKRLSRNENDLKNNQKLNEEKKKQEIQNEKFYEQNKNNIELKRKIEKVNEKQTKVKN